SYPSGASDHRRTGAPARRRAKGEAATSVDLTLLLQQREEQFAYEVISHALDRSVGRNRFLNTLFFILIAAQGAISAIIRDRIDEYPALDAALLAGFVFALGGA